VKKFIIKVLMIILIVVLLITVYNHLASVSSIKYNGASTADQINMSFKNAISDKYNCYFLGNSRIYRDINPELFTTVKSYNFAHDNDSYNQMYYKFLYLLDHDEQIDYLIIGTDYFQFSFLSDTRNYIYSRLFPEEYLADYENTSWLESKEAYYTRLWTNKQNAILSCIQYILKRPEPEKINYQKENGQYVVNGEADPNARIDRDYSILDVQYDYFIKIIELCEKENIQLFVIMPPLWEGETESHSAQERREFNNMINDALSRTNYRDNYINYSEEMGLSSYQDFIDVTHLKPAAADTFSQYINDRVFGETK
jgi:hypothetical protein